MAAVIRGARMALIALLLGVAGVEGSEFTASKPRLEARVALEKDSYWHLGGFCFGHDADDLEVGILQGQLDWAGRRPLHHSRVYLAGFDGREDRWGQAAKTWNSSSCQQKLEEASAYTQLRSAGHVGGFTIRILQGTGTRDWHFVLLSCGEVEAATLELELEAESGALSIFEANTQFHQSSCPALQSQGWWQTASQEFGFWTFVLLAIFCGSCGTFLIGCLARRWGSHEAKGVGNEVVIGRPCEAATEPSGDAIAKGHPHGKVQV